MAAQDGSAVDPHIEVYEPLIPGPEESWNESQFIWWSDKEKGVSGYHRIAHQPNRETAHIWNIVIADDGSYTRRNNDKLKYEDWMREGGKYSVEGVSIEHLEKGKIRVVVDQDGFEADIIFNDVYDALPLSDYVPEDRYHGFMTDISVAHFECGGKVIGTVTFDGRTIEVDGTGHRDHSWGPRETQQIQTSNWMNGTTGPEFSMFLTSVALFKNDVMKLGYIVENGKRSIVTDWDFRPMMEVDGVTYTEGRGWFETEDNRKFDIEYNGLVGGAVVNHGEWIGFEGIMEYTATEQNGTTEHKGRFLLERGVNCCGGKIFPGTMLNGANVDGTGTMKRAR